MYYNYHAKLKKLIKEDELISITFSKSYNKISPALIFHFKNHKPMPVREYRWHEYEETILNFIQEIKKVH